MALLRRGLSGEPVRILQAKLGVNADGVFGQGTETALIEYQRANGLSATGQADPTTLAVMPGFPEFTPEKVAASVVSESTQPVDDSALASAKAEPPPAPSLLQKVEHGIVAVIEAPLTLGKSIWTTVKSIF